MPYNLYPAVDENYDFAPEVREALASSPELRSQVIPLTETERNNLVGDQLWTNRLIFNTTIVRINRYTGTQWVELSTEAPGIVKMFAGTSPPQAHVLCDGSLIPRSGINLALFAIIGTQYNTGGEPTTHFRVPNLKGRVVVGVDASQGEFNDLGETGGAKSHTLSTAEMPAHGHGGATGGQTQDHSHSGSTAGEGGHVHTGEQRSVQGVAAGAGTSVLGAWPDVNLDEGAAAATKAGSGNHGHAFSTGGASLNHLHGISTEGGGGAHNNLQPYITLNYIITL